MSPLFTEFEIPFCEVVYVNEKKQGWSHSIIRRVLSYFRD